LNRLPAQGIDQRKAGVTQHEANQGPGGHTGQQHQQHRHHLFPLPATNRQNVPYLFRALCSYNVLFVKPPFRASTAGL
jgi:hypothetical protein